MLHLAGDEATVIAGWPDEQIAVVPVDGSFPDAGGHRAG
jgi:hypothetical protein